MVMVDLGIPPGFDLLSEDLQAFQEKTAGRKGGRLEKFSLTATQAILYFDSIGAGETVTLHFRLRAKYPMRARTFQSRVYEYYDPDVKAVARPVQLEVARRSSETLPELPEQFHEHAAGRLCVLHRQNGRSRARFFARRSSRCYLEACVLPLRDGLRHCPADVHQVVSGLRKSAERSEKKEGPFA